MPWNVWNVTQQKWMLLNSVRSKSRALSAIDEVFEAEKAIYQLEPRRVVPVLEAHGTKLMQLNPAVIWRAAQEDIAKRTRNSGASVVTCEHFAFHRKHVRKAETPNDILRAAIAEPQVGRESAKPNTRLLYADIELLKAALQ